MATKGRARGGVRTSAWQKMLAILVAAMLSLTACSPGNQVIDIEDDITPMTEAPTEQAEIDEAAQAEEGYTQTLEDGTVVSSDALDVSEMEIEVVKVEEQAPEAVEAPTEALDPETTEGSEEASADLEDVMTAAMGLDSAETGAAVMAAGDSTVGGLTISGGTVNTDFTHAANQVVIKKSGTYTLSGSFTGTVQIEAGVDAWLILNGVIITANNASSPINLFKGATAHIILADGTTNTLNANQQGCAALHCGDGSTLYIDDAVVNYDFAAKKHIDVLYGVVDTPGEVTNMTTGAKHNVVKGDILKKVTSAGVVGKLIAKGGKGAAGIGAGPKEVSGTMVFDGGYIEAYSWGGHSNNFGNNSAAVGTGVTNAEGVNVNDSSGTGIGGGAGGGGATQTTFNSGIIYAFGSYHGAGIGAGWSSAGTYGLQTGASSVTRNANNCGNININGGYILSQGYAHGNAFGGACGTNMTGNTVRITGGTLRPFSHTSRADIGGSGGYVIIDGGSISLSGTQAAKFMSSNNKAYSDVARTQEVVPIEVDLAAETGTVDYTITNWALYIDGVQQAYGAPYSFNAGKLTLWLPPTAKTQKVTVELNYYNESTGSEVLVEPLYREAGSTASTVKRNVYFDMPVQTVFGADVETETEALPTITNFPNELLVDGKVPENITAIQKKYDGLPFETIEITNLSITESKSRETRTLTNNSLVTYSYRLLNGNTFSDELTGAQMPSDTGLMAFAMNSTEFAQGEWGKSYIGHRSNGWCRIVPVPAVLTMEGAEWGNLNLETGAWMPTTSADDEPGNRIKVSFNIRSAENTAVTCKVPTGSVQLYIEGKKFGSPILLDKDVIEADGFSTYTVSEGPTEKSANTPQAMASRDNRWTAHVVYYMDPANADGLLKAKSTFRTVSKSEIVDNATPMADSPEGDDENKYNLTAEYQPDKNYVEGVEANPKNADAKATIIIPVDSPIDVADDQGGVYKLKDTDPTDTPDGPGENPAGGKTGKAADVTGGGKTYEYDTITKNYSDFHKKDADGNETIEKDHFVLKLDSKSDMPMTWVSSDPAVADVMRDADGNVVVDENGDPKVVVYSCGEVQLVMHQPGNAVFNEQTYKYNYRIAPDPGIKPDTEARVIWQNLTHPGMPAAPGDEIEYTIVGSNLTDGSAWQDVNLGDLVSDNVTINLDTVQVAKNFGTPEDRGAITAADLAELDFQPVDDASMTTTKAGTQVVANVGTVYGGQSTALKFTVTVNDSLVDRISMTGENPPTIPNTPKADGTYGVKEAQDMQPGEEPGKPVPVTDTVIIGIEATDVPQAAVLPKDPVLGGPDGQIQVAKDAQNLTAIEQNRTSGVTLPGDKVAYSITVSNTEPDSCLHWPVIRDTLPQGITPVAGSFELTMVDGSKKAVDDKVFVPITNTVALYVDDLYYNESVTLTFECTVGENASTADNVAHLMGTTPSDKWRGEHSDDPDVPVVPDGPKAQELLGGELVTPEPTDDDPEAGEPAPGVTIGEITNPDGPLATAVKADPEDPSSPELTDPEDPTSTTPEPILPGDVIIKFGDKQPPTGPQDIANEMDRLIKEKVAEDPEATSVDIPVTIQRENPEDPDNPEIINIIVTVPIPPAPEPIVPPAPGDPWTPDSTIPTEEYPWDDFDWGTYDEENGIPEVKNDVPATPGVLIPANDPVVGGNPSDITVQKTGENLTRGGDGDTYVGDRVRYTVEVSNSKAGTTWFNCVVRDDLPQGVDIDLSTAKVITSAGQEVAVEGAAYNALNRVLAVNIGHVPGGQVAKLVFEATITEAAAGSNVGNVAYAYGTPPSKVNPDDLAEGKHAPGTAFDPMKETGMSWPDYDKANPPLSNAEPAYPSQGAKDGGFKPADQAPEPRVADDGTSPDNGNGGPDNGKGGPDNGNDGNGDNDPKLSDTGAEGAGAGDGDGDGDGWGTGVVQRFLQLAQTGDPMFMAISSLVLVAAGAGIALIVLAVRRRKAEEE